MDETEFWAIIDRARGASHASPEVPSANPERLRAVLGGESDETVSAFGLRFYEELVRLNRWELWGAGYVIQGGMSGDGFHYFRSWLVGKGKAAVEQALSDPDGLAPYVTDPEEIENELLEYVAVEIMEARGGEDPRSAFAGEQGPDDEPSGEAFDEESVEGDSPRLAAKFG